MVFVMGLQRSTHRRWVFYKYMTQVTMAIFSNRSRTGLMSLQWISSNIKVLMKINA